MTKIFLHGANATPKSWNYIRSQIGDGIMISYNSGLGFKNNLEMMKSQLQDVENLEFISHSLGGIYALHLADHFSDRVKCGISLSTPYGGVNVPMVARYYLYWHRLFHDIVPTAWPIATVNDIKLRWPWTNVVTVSGSMPWNLKPNDGVVSIESQRHRSDMELIDLDANHYEVVLSDQAVEIIKARL